MSIDAALVIILHGCLPDLCRAVCLSGGDAGHVPCPTFFCIIVFGGLCFSGVCIYNRVELIDGEWQIVRWSGFVSCDLPTAGLQQLAGDDAPNRVPAAS